MKELEEIKYIEVEGEVLFESHQSIVNDKRHPGYQGDYRQYKKGNCQLTVSFCESMTLGLSSSSDFNQNSNIRNVDYKNQDNKERDQNVAHLLYGYYVLAFHCVN